MNGHDKQLRIVTYVHAPENVKDFVRMQSNCPQVHPQTHTPNLTQMSFQHRSNRQVTINVFMARLMENIMLGTDTELYT